MLVNSVSSNNTSKPHFTAIYKSGKNFSNVQEKVANSVIEEFKKFLPPKNKTTLQDYFQKKGYDFVIEPKDNELVSIKAYRGFRLEGTGVDRYATYEKGGSYLVGDYNIEATSNLSRDLKKVLF